MIANDNDEAVMESCAEVIGHAYEENTPLADQIRLKEKLYGDKQGNIGAVLLTENFIWDRDQDQDQENVPASDREKSMFQRATEAAKANRCKFNMRIRYICEAVRKNWENLCKANFEKTLLPNILLYQAEAENANFHGAILSGGRLFETRFDGANMREAHLEGANLERAILINTDLEGAFLEPPDPEQIPREPDHLDHTKLQGARMDFAHLKQAHLTNADLSIAHLENADLTDAHLEGADLAFAHLEGANLTGANLEGADLSGANLEGASINQAALAKTKGKYKGLPRFVP
jgi:uncharacterized protein YjbI with pentapeptide repeats